MRDSKQQPVPFIAAGSDTAKSPESRASMFLDRALSKEDASLFLQEAQQNPALQTALKQEESFRSLIRNGVHRRKASTALIQSIKDKIRTAPH
jgi:hypothetical protein